MNKAVAFVLVLCLNLIWIAPAQNASGQRRAQKSPTETLEELRQKYRAIGVPENDLDYVVQAEFEAIQAARENPTDKAGELRRMYASSGLPEEMIEELVQADLSRSTAPARSPLALKKEKHDKMMEDLRSDEVRGHPFYERAAVYFDGKAKPLEARAIKAAAIREKKEIEEKTPVELQWEWYMHLAAALHATSKSRHLIQKAEYQDPMLPPLDTGNAAEIFEMAVSDFKTLLENPPKRKRAKPGKNSARKPATGRRN